MRTLAIAKASIRRLLRDRTALFFVIVLPIVVILVVGAVARGFGTFRVGVVATGSTAAERQLVHQLGQTSGLDVVRYTSVAALDRAVARGEVNAGLVVPAGLYADEVAGRSARVQVVAEEANTTQQAAATRLAAVVASYGGRVQAAQFATRFGAPFGPALAKATALSPEVPRVQVATRTVSAAQRTLPAGYEYSAPTELVLFVFLSAVAGAATVVETRRLGIFERMAAAPVRPGTIIVGESSTFAAVALCQSVLIVGIGALVFGVSWGDPLAAAALLLVWCLVGAGAGMLASTMFRTPEQASAIGPVVGIVLAMLGGCMWPLSIVSPVMRSIGHVTPQAWAVDAWTDLLSDHGTVLTIGRDLGILALFAVGFFVVATVRHRRMLA
ncbi:MAG TPA: ABC transporter permease [Acidimicrobiales bacterium]|nr:ABC transporter permease [Acidimicrobiales bacterium]